MTTKRCCDCGIDKPLTEFWRNRSRRDGRQSACKACGTARSARWRTTNPERQAVLAERGRLGRHGLTPERYAELLAMQGGRCAICRTDDPGARAWSVDHDHACCSGVYSCGGCIRGLLCIKCNTMLGAAGDRITTLEQAARYLLARERLG